MAARPAPDDPLPKYLEDDPPSDPHIGPRKVGRPSHQPTDKSRQLVQVLHAHGISHRVIAKLVGLAEPKSVRKYYRAELDDAVVQVEAAMGAAIVAAAQNGKWGAAKYWLIVHGDPKWRVAEKHLIGGDPDADPIRVDVHDLTDEELDQRVRELERKRSMGDRARALLATLPKRPNDVEH